MTNRLRDIWDLYGMYDCIRKRFFWPRLFRTVHRYVTHCRECQRRKAVPLKPTGALIPIPPAEAPFQRIGMDLLGRLPKSQGGNRWIIVCTDYMTRYAITKALPTAEAPEVSKFFVEEIILTHETPRTIITDRGTVFQSNLIAEINNQCKVVHRMTTAYHPQTNGLTERFNKTLADMLAMYVDVEQKTRDRILPFVSFAYNTARQDTTGFTPFFLKFGHEAGTKLDAMFQEPIEYTVPDFLAQLVTQAEESRQLARIRTLDAQEKDRRRYNSRHRAVLYQQGDLVWIYIPVRKVGRCEKLLKKYFGSYQVLRKLSDVTYEVHDFDPNSRRRKSKDIAPVLRMKPYYDPDLQAHFNDSAASDDRRFGESTPSTGRNDYTGPTTRSISKALRQTR
ncbi:retrovirus-related Pol polyprotein from transposon 412 [Trichonephila inaurata madagascariensis]|uniref:RNA-directed DNA polymerase n=1 Tax=Trichonephila inaurata madagascariensis TaxID=2747483 RepID=A0A8X6IQ40_9ARAC|nr:retrovirus-related Pol polyprotein from transposon 412 [Trichonephila inaurata madagascariensis]